MSYESFPRPVACMLACIKLGSHYSFVLVLLTGNDKIKNNSVLSMVVMLMKLFDMIDITSSVFEEL